MQTPRMTYETSDEALAADQRGCDAYHAWRDDQPTDLHRRSFVAPAKRVEALDEVEEYMPPPCKLQGRLDEIRAEIGAAAKKGTP